MKKILFSTLIAFTLTACSSNADENKKLSDEELVAKFMKSEKELQKAKEKTKALDKLEKTVDELGKTLQVDK